MGLFGEKIALQQANHFWTAAHIFLYINNQEVGIGDKLESSRNRRLRTS